MVGGALSSQRVRRPSETLLSEWGGPPLVDSEKLRRSVEEVQSDLQGLVDDLAWGPLHRVTKSGREYLGELRKRILVHLRRLLFHVESEGGTDFRSRAREQLAELAKNLRVNVLGRATRATHAAWTPLEIGEALERRLASVPVSLRVPHERESYVRRAGDGLDYEFRRMLLVADRWLRRSSGDEGPERDIELRSFLGHHLFVAEMEALEGLAVLLVQAEVKLEGRARSVFDLVAGSLGELIARPDNLAENLARLRDQVEDELGLAEEEHQRYIDDLHARARRSLAGAAKAAKRELRDIGTYRLPNRERSQTRIAETRARLALDVKERLDACRAAASGGHGLLGMRLELQAFSVQVTERLDAEIGDLERGLKGRSLKQVERLHAAVDHVVSILEGGEERPQVKLQDSDPPTLDETLPEPTEERRSDALAEGLEQLGRVLRDAQRAAQQLVDQLTSDQALAAPLEVVAREAGRLTDYYVVPIRRLAPTEWTLPEAPELVTLPFRKLVSTFVETDVAPRLLEVTAQGASNFQPILAALAEVERVVHLGGGQLEGDDALVREIPAELGETRAVLAGAFVEVRNQLVELERTAGGWPRELGRDLRRAARDRLDELQRGFDEEGLPTTVASAEEPEDRPDRLRSELDRLGGLITGLGHEGRRRVRDAVGEDRIADVRRALGFRAGLDGDERIAPFDSPGERAAVPPFYRRLFAGQATWAGDVLDEHQGAVEVAREVLTLPTGAGARAVALVGAEGSGRRALLGALSRGDRFGPSRRLAFSRPVDPDEVKAALQEIGSGQVVLLTGLRWLLSASRGGFEPLRTLTEGILADGGRNAFLVEAQALVWAWAGSVAPLRDVFGAEIHVSALEPEPLERALLARHRLSGLRLVFPPGESEEAARQRHFQRLHRASDGLLQVALAYWLASLDEVDERTGVVRVGEVPPSPHEALAALPEETLQVLYLVERQGWMSPEVLGEVMGGGLTRGRAVLGRLRRLGLLETVSEQRVSVRRHLQGPLDAVLRERGWL